MKVSNLVLCKEVRIYSQRRDNWVKTCITVKHLSQHITTTSFPPVQEMWLNDRREDRTRIFLNKNIFFIHQLISNRDDMWHMWRKGDCCNCNAWIIISQTFTHWKRNRMCNELLDTTECLGMFVLASKLHCEFLWRHKKGIRSISISDFSHNSYEVNVVFYAIYLSVYCWQQHFHFYVWFLRMSLRWYSLRMRQKIRQWISSLW